MTLAPVNWGPVNTAEPPSVFRRYLSINQERGLGQIVRSEAKDAPLYIVCSGPSLIDTWHELTPKQGEIWALNAAFDFLCKNGIRPDYGVCIAAEAPILNYFQKIEIGDKFLFASQVHPGLVDRAIGAGGKVTFWNPAHPAEWDMPGPKETLIYGGGTIGLRVFDLAWVLGFRDVHVLGLDACNSPDGRIAVETPMYESRKKDLRTFSVNGRSFVALPSHAKQVEDFGAVVRPLQGMSITMYGDGLMQWAQQSQQQEIT